MDDFKIGDEIVWVGPQTSYSWYGDGQRCKIVGFRPYVDNGKPIGFDIRPADGDSSDRCWTSFEHMAKQWEKVPGTPEEQVSDWIDKVRAS